jgi:hypothetical protein
MGYRLADRLANLLNYSLDVFIHKGSKLKVKILYYNIIIID